MSDTRVVLHIGMPNAGSSAVQHGLFRHRDDLGACGLHYYTGGKSPRLISSGNGKDVAAYLIPRRREQAFSEAVFERTFAGRFLSSDHAVSVISAEQLAGAPADRLEDFRLRLLQGRKVQVVAFVRDIYAHVRSCWMQQIKRRAYLHGFERYATESYEDSQCGAALRFGRVFGFDKVTVIHMDGLKTDLFRTFLDAVGISTRFDPLPRINRGLSPGEVEALRLCNRVHRNADLATRVSDHLLQARPDAPRASVWSPRIAADLEARFRGRIDRVNIRYFAKAQVLGVGAEPSSADIDVVEDRIATWRAVLSALAHEGWRLTRPRRGGIA